MTLRGLAATRRNELLVQQRRGVGIQMADRHSLMCVILRNNFPLLCNSKATIYSTRWLCADCTEGAWVAATRNSATFAMKERQLDPMLVCSGYQGFLPARTPQ
jgi:hypothetical protein